MEVSVRRSPVPLLSASQEPGEERAAAWSCRVGWGDGTLHSSAAVQPVEG